MTIRDDTGIVEVTGEDGRSRLRPRHRVPHRLDRRIDRARMTGRALETCGRRPYAGSRRRDCKCGGGGCSTCLDTDALLTTQVYASYQEAADDADRVNDVSGVAVGLPGVIAPIALKLLAVRSAACRPSVLRATIP